MACSKQQVNETDDKSKKYEERIKALDDFTPSYYRELAEVLQDNRKPLIRYLNGENAFRWRNELPPIANEVDSCAFCLSRKVCRKIYPEESISEGIHGHMPLLSIVLHLSYYDIYILLQYCLKWYQIYGLSSRLNLWIFSCLMCLDNPITCQTEDLLLELYSVFKREVKNARGVIKLRMALILKTLTSLFTLSIQSDVAKLYKYKELYEKLTTLD